MVAALAGLQSTTLGVAAATVSSAAIAPDCHAVKFIGVRGSGDTSSTLGVIASGISDALAAQAHDVGVDYGSYGLPYTAVGIDVWKPTMPLAYWLSERQGRNMLRAYIKKQTQDCVSEHLVVEGYSQGAQVVGDVFSKGVGGLSASELTHVTAVVLVADPRFNSREPYDAGGFQEGRNGILGARTPSDLSSVVARIRAWCRSNDIVCQGHGATANHSQGRYIDDYKTEILSFIGQRLGWKSAGVSPTLLVLRSSTSSANTYDLYGAGKDGSRLRRLTTGVAGAAFGAGETIFVTRPISSSPNTGSCDLYKLSPSERILAWTSVVGLVNRGYGLCSISSNGRGGVFFRTSNGTAASEDVWNFDLSRRNVTHAAYGYAPSASMGGMWMSVLVHEYYPTSGSYEMPFVLAPGAVEGNGIVPIPDPSKGPYYSAEAISPDGNTMALGTYEAGVEKIFEYRLSVSHLSLMGSPTLLWRVPTGSEVWQLGFYADGELLAVLAASAKARSATLYDLPRNGGVPHALVSGVSSIAISY